MSGCCDSFREKQTLLEGSLYLFPLLSAFWPVDIAHLHMGRLPELRLFIIALFVALIHAQGRSKWGTFQGPWSVQWDLTTGQAYE